MSGAQTRSSSFELFARALVNIVNLVFHSPVYVAEVAVSQALCDKEPKNRLCFQTTCITCALHSTDGICYKIYSHHVFSYFLWLG